MTGSKQNRAPVDFPRSLCDPFLLEYNCSVCGWCLATSSRIEISMELEDRCIGIGEERLVDLSCQSNVSKPAGREQK